MSRLLKTVLFWTKFWLKNPVLNFPKHFGESSATFLFKHVPICLYVLSEREILIESSNQENYSQAPLPL